MSCSAAKRKHCESEDVKEFHLGVPEGKRTSFREIKQYKRRKRGLA